MAVHFHPLKVKQVQRETQDCVVLTFEVPPHLAETFTFREGQNITIKANFNGEEQRRSYSLCTSPQEKEIKVAVKKVPSGLFSSYANEKIKAGDVLDVLPPVGKFNAKLEAGKMGEYLAIAAGSGITPVISIIKHTLETQPHSRFTLLYGNRSRSSIIFFEELEGLKNKYMQRFNLINILSREKTESPINNGRIDKDKLEELGAIVPYQQCDSIYLCGPEELIFSSRDFLEDQGINPGKIHFELFTTPGQKQTNKSEKKEVVNNDSGPKSLITVKLDGRSISFDLAPGGQNILDAALAQGADLPYACKGGVCCTCRAKLVTGEVKMDVNYALEPEEVEQGFILCCQSHPLTKEVVVDFDLK
jgi:ring-1,2-phenylacetyl-CoA epoxidase subunit PaaE